MAAAARPGSPDARDGRVPCPLCGGLIHPIAGKCKHCKADLSTYRSARPAASAPLPPLHHAGNGVATHAPIGHAAPVALAYDTAQPVLPPRPATRVQPVQPAGSAWRSWPILVIVVAMMAIVAAVVLMMWPAAHPSDGKRVLQPPPAPERMDTQTPPPTPRAQPQAQPPAQGSADPWSMRPRDVPAPGAAGAPSADPDDAATTADPADQTADAFDPFNSPHALPHRRRALSANAGDMMTLALAHLCRKLDQCGADIPMRNRCGLLAQVPAPPLARCPAARRCLRTIDMVSCTDPPDPTRLDQLLLQFSHCVDAAQC